MANEEGVDVALGGGESVEGWGGGWSRWQEEREEKRSGCVFGLVTERIQGSKISSIPHVCIFFFCSFLETNLFSSPGEPLFPFLDDIDLLFFLEVNFVELEMNKWIE